MFFQTVFDREISLLKNKLSTRLVLYKISRSPSSAECLNGFPSGLKAVKHLPLPWESIRKAAIDVTAPKPTPESLADAIFAFQAEQKLEKFSFKDTSSKYAATLYDFRAEFIPSVSDT
ncbi:hypothetical protein PsorP6_006716 [Peronosclerospora sorghi]|uniref:Uncharacterized protein n=1 Tax=Peronosclerospora sorghi TaxID=230839 RepID=A0ACC0W4G5_9STRA|nr:hypothetical protein PsorP6_006716 [Peronosclerospora sorghi]